MDANRGKRPATEAEARALASALRLRILRLCLDDALTNKEIAARLKANPATILHHIRTLVATGFLASEGERRGTRGAREIPYRATGKSWNLSITDKGAAAQAMIGAFLQELQLADEPARTYVTRLGLRLSDADQAELLGKLAILFEEYRLRPASPHSEPISLFFAMHPDTGRSPGR